MLSPQLRWSNWTIRKIAGSYEVLRLRRPPPPGPPCTKTTGLPCGFPLVLQKIRFADDGDAAMGLRVVGLHLANCGATAYHVEGYPQLQLLDEKRQPVRGVEILQGTDGISTGIAPDGAPGPVTLQPGESATATLAWRNTTGSGDPVDAPYVRVTPKPGAASVVVTPELDLGTTGRLGVSAWKKPTP